MANLANVYKITEEQFDTLLEGGSITSGDVTYTYDPNSIYLVPDEQFYVSIGSYTSSLSSGSVTIVNLSDTIAKYDMIVIRATIGSSSNFFTISVPRILLQQVFTSDYPLVLKGLSSYALKIGYVGETTLQATAVGTTVYAIYIYGVVM